MKKFFVVLIIVIILGSLIFVAWKFWFKKESISTGKVLSIPQEILKNKFGFLSGAPDDVKMIKGSGALWARPHVGPFLWDAMQSKKTEEIFFNKTDWAVKRYQKGKIGILATLWPFADWDQKMRTDYSECEVSSLDEFLPEPRLEKKGDYLPKYRCNPHDWPAYKKWVMAVVERYDGDGKLDMPGLEIPIKYWEVMNEPDLVGPEDFEESRLEFYREDPQAYAKLLIQTYQAIKEADPEAFVLIAGAAGGGGWSLDFYREVFKNSDTQDAFDIANVHCISNDDYQSFNVEPYQEMLEEFGIEKPIWVTEAEAVVSDNPDLNATQTLKSTKKALELGAKRIFFTRYDFELRMMGDKEFFPPDHRLDIKPEIEGDNPEKAYRIITSQ